MTNTKIFDMFDIQAKNPPTIESTRPEFDDSGLAIDSANDAIGNLIIADPNNFTQGNAMTETTPNKTPPHIRFPKSLFDDKIFKSWPAKFKFLFLKFIELARFTPCDYNDHGVCFRLEVGQFCNTIRGILAEVGDEYTRYDIEKFLKIDKNQKFFRQEIKNKKSVITITHLDTYKLILNQSLGENLRQDFRQDLRQEKDDLSSNESTSYESSKEKSQTGFQTGSQTQVRHKAIKNNKELKKATTCKKAAVDAAAFSSNESYEFLVQFGVDPKVAQGLSTHPLEYIKEKVSLVMARKNVGNLPGYLVDAIKRDWVIPCESKNFDRKQKKEDERIERIEKNRAICEGMARKFHGNGRICRTTSNAMEISNLIGDKCMFVSFDSLEIDKEIRKMKETFQIADGA